MAWKWNEKSHRYYDVDTGRFLPSAQVLDWTRSSISSSGIATDKLAEMVAEGIISPDHWELLMREEIKREYIRQYLSGIGGVNQMTPADWGSIGGMLKEQYSYLPEFRRQIAAGELSEAQIRARSRMYSRSAKEAYERAHGKVAKAAGNDEELWVLGLAEHCVDCINFSNEGWQPIGYFPEPGAGHTVCLTNCGCHKEYRDSTTGTIWP